MPGTSKQRRFMGLVYGIQRGKISPNAAGPKASKAARNMNPSDVKDFLMQECGLKECGIDVKRRLLSTLKEIQEPMNLEEDSVPSVISSSKTLHGDFEQTLRMYRKNPFKPQENQAIQSFDEVKPISHDKTMVKYNKSNSFTQNSTIAIIKSQAPDGKYFYTAFIKVRGGQDSSDPSAEPTPQQASEGDEIKIVNSIPIDDNEGSEILTNFLQEVYHRQA